MRNSILFATASIAGALAFATPAQSALTLVRPCAATDITLGAGASFTSCAGYYDGNLFNNSNNTDIQDGLDALGPPSVPFTTFAAIPDANKLSSLNGATTIDFGQTLYGDTVVGVHFGAGQGSPGYGYGPPNGGGKPTNLDTSVFYRFNAGTTGISSFTLNYKASSNAVLFMTGGGPAVPEPATWALMVGGFGLLGISMRRRRTITKATLA